METYRLECNAAKISSERSYSVTNCLSFNSSVGSSESFLLCLLSLYKLTEKYRCMIYIILHFSLCKIVTTQRFVLKERSICKFQFKLLRYKLICVLDKNFKLT